MQGEELRALLLGVQQGKVDLNAAMEALQQPDVADIGFAHVDLQRRQRCGFPEVIFCEGKTPEWVIGVVQKLIEAGQDCLATRVSDEQSRHLTDHFPDAEQDRVARTFWLPQSAPSSAKQGTVVVLTAGTSDLPVAREAVVTAQAMGSNVKLFADVGVAGIHRVLRYRDEFAAADAIVVVAGWIGGLSRDCRAHECRVRGRLRRRRGAADDAQ